MRSTILFIMVFLLLVSAYGAEPIPPGTPFGTVYVRVTDCITGAPIQGASVNLDNPTHRTDGLTNSTGYASIEAFAWFYTYYVTASGYRVDAGERRFSLGEVFNVCLVPEAAGFWRVVADVLAWQGDIHAGGSGWAIIRLKNLEAGVFNITEFQIWVAGYDGPAITYTVPKGVILDRLVERSFNISVNPRPEVPTGRLKAELRFRAVFTGADGRSIGPLTVSTDLDYVMIAPYRSFRIQVMDKWGQNPVPGAVVEFIPTLPNVEGSFTYQADENGYIDVKRVNDGAYLTRIKYLSPYDEKVYLVAQQYTILIDLVKQPFLRSSLYEVHVDVRDLGNRPLETDVYLNGVRAFSENGLARFVNVPQGMYSVSVRWMDVEVYTSQIRVEEPLVINKPGAQLQATVDVGDIGVKLETLEGKQVNIPVKILLTPRNRLAENVSSTVFERLPRGEYAVKVQAYDFYRERYVDVGEGVFALPRDHGQHVIRVNIFDVVVELVDKQGRHVDAELTIEGKPVTLRGGKATLTSLTPGPYRFKASWNGYTVLDIMAEPRPGETLKLTAEIYKMRLRVLGVDDQPLMKASAILWQGQSPEQQTVVNGSTVFDQVPAGTHQLTIFLEDVAVFNGTVETGEEVSVVVEAGWVELFFHDHNGAPISGVEVVAAGFDAQKTGADGVARLGQRPLGSYGFTARYRGFTVFEGVAKAGNRTEFTLPLYSLKATVVNELDTPIEASITLTRGDVSLGTFTGSEAAYYLLPPGPYVLKASVGTKQAVQQVNLLSDGQVYVIKVPVTLVLGNIALSSSDLLTILLPIAVAVVAVASIAGLRKAAGQRRKRAKGMV
ncbi:MAG: carboxypeptidase-like regulatory domain-containing protein [Candidatus Caldarchaeum sp.]